jgi:hypothetical protein
MCAAVILRFISMAAYGIDVATPSQIILYNVSISLMIAAFLLVGLVWLYMLKRIKNSNWTSRRTNIVVVIAAVIQVVIQTLLIGSTLFLSSDLLATVILVYQMWLGLTFIGFLVFVVPTTFRALRLLNQIQDFVTTKGRAEGQQREGRHPPSRSVPDRRLYLNRNFVGYICCLAIT